MYGSGHISSRRDRQSRVRNLEHMRTARLEIAATSSPSPPAAFGLFDAAASMQVGAKPVQKMYND